LRTQRLSEFVRYALNISRATTDCGHIARVELIRLAGVYDVIFALSQPKMLSVANAFKISDHQYNPR
jgi:hypothetical protein